MQPTTQSGHAAAIRERLRGGTALGTLSPLIAVALASCGGGGGGGSAVVVTRQPLPTSSVDIIDGATDYKGESTFSFAVSESTTDVVGKVMTTTDTAGPTSFSFIGNSHGFTIDGDGTIRRPSLPDREAGGRYELTVLARDARGQDSVRVIVTVTDDNDHAPAFDFPAGESSYTFNVSEDDWGAVGAVSATDRDATFPSSHIVYSIAAVTPSVPGGDPNNLFWIDSRGVIHRAWFDHEMDDEYELTVVARNLYGTREATATVTVTVRDSADAPKFKPGMGGQAISVEDDVTGMVGMVAAADPDAAGPGEPPLADNRITYAIAGDPHGYAINAETGEVSRMMPNIGTPTWHELTVVAASNLRAATTTVTVSSTELGRVLTAMEGAEGSYQIPASASGGPFTGNPATYSVPGDMVSRNGKTVARPAWLTVDGTGTVRVAGNMTDDGDVGIWTVTVRAMGGELMDPETTSLDVFIEDAGEAPVLAVASSPIPIGQGDRRTLGPADIMATDPDPGTAPGDLRIYLDEQPAHGRLEANYTTGTVNPRTDSYFPAWQEVPDGVYFTQAHLDAGLIRYVAGVEDETLKFRVSDGEIMNENIFTLSFDVDPDGGLPPAPPAPGGTAMVTIHELHPLTKPVHVFANPDNTAGVSLATDNPDTPDHAMFRIDDEGRLWAREVLDFENPADRNLDNIYRIEVVHGLDTSGMSTTLRTTLDITVEDIAEEKVGETPFPNRITTSGADSLRFTYDEIPDAERPGEQASYIIAGSAFAMPLTGPLELTWSFSAAMFTDHFTPSAGIGTLSTAIDSLAEIEHLRWVLERSFDLYEQAANIRFTEVDGTTPGTRGDLNIGFYPIDNNGDGYSTRGGGVAYFPGVAEDITIGYYPIRDNTQDLTDVGRVFARLDEDTGMPLDPVRSNLGWYVVLHEIGHSIGLKHPWDGGPTYGFWPTNGPRGDRDRSDEEPYASNTVMDYNRKPTVPGQPDVGAYMLGSADIEALRFLYGAPGPDNDWEDGVQGHLGYALTAKDFDPRLVGFAITNFVTVDENLPAAAVVFQAESGAGGSWALPAGYLDNALFTIDADDGEVRFRQSPDFENPLDGDEPANDPKFGRNNDYALYLTKGGARQQGYLVTVEDVADESAPQANRAPWSGAAIRDHQTPEGMMLDITIPDNAFQDPDGMEDKMLTYTVADNKVLKDWVEISKPGWLDVAGTMVQVAATTDDADVGVYRVTIAASDGNTGNAAAETTFTLTITDTNEHDPTFTVPMMPVGIAAGATRRLFDPGKPAEVPKLLTAMDEDASDGPKQLTYTLGNSSAGGTLEVNRVTDQLFNTKRWTGLDENGTFTQKQVDDGDVRFVAGKSVHMATISLTVRDAGGRESPAQDLVFQVGANTPPRKGADEGDDIGVVVFNKGRAGSFLIPDRAFDDDEDDNNLMYALESVEQGGSPLPGGGQPTWLTLSNLGLLRVSAATGNDDVGLYTLTVSATDGVSGNAQADTEFHLVIADIA